MLLIKKCMKEKLAREYRNSEVWGRECGGGGEGVVLWPCQLSIMFISPISATPAAMLGLPVKTQTISVNDGF